MKVLELCLSAGLGGLELYFSRSTILLTVMGYECIPVTDVGSQLEKRLQQLDLRPVSLKRKSRYLPILNALKLARLVDSQRIDIIHMHWAKDLALAALAKRLSKRKPKLVYTRHMEIYGDKNDFYHRFVYSNVDLMLTVTRRMAKQAIRCLPLSSEKIKTLYIGIQKYKGNREDDRQEFRQKYNIQPDSFLVGMVGRIEPGKRQHLLLEALGSLIDDIPELRCAIIGGSKNQDYLGKLKNQVNNGPLNGKVIFVGFFEQPRKAMAAFDIALLATSCETFGLVLIEAMSTGTAAVGSRACGVLEIIKDGENGLMFNPDNKEDLAAKVKTLYQDKTLRDRLATAGRKSVDERFSEEQHYLDLIAELDRLLQDSAT
jgi:glycosyltransferase involved in cell wall biosynthesis